MPPEATNPSPGTVPTAPAAVVPAPAATDAPKGPEGPKPTATVTRRTYATATGPKVRPAGPPPGATAAPTNGTAPPLAAAAAAQSAPEARSAPTEPREAATAGADSAAAEKPADTPAADAAPKDADPDGKVTDSDLAQRLAKISRAERRLGEDRRLHADRLAVADAVVQALGPGAMNPQTVQHALRQASLVAQSRQAAHQDPIGFLHRVFGVDPQAVYQRAIDGAIAHAGRPPEAKAKDDVRAIVAEAIAPYEQQLRQAEQRTQQEQQARQVEDYQRTTIAPIVQDTKFTAIRQWCEVRGEDPVRAVYDALVQRYQQTGRAPDPRALLEELEPVIQSRIAKTFGGPSATPAGQATAKRVETPKAPPEVSRRTAAEVPSRAPPLTRPRLNGKPYTTRPL